jgi:hypothetical protein
VLFLLYPSLQPNLTTAFLKAHFADQFLAVGETAKLEIPHAAFGAVKMPASGSHCAILTRTEGAWL